MNYYNEHDLKAAAWLEMLIATGSIPAGIVDRRSIEGVQPDDVRGFTQCHWFAGIGGWSLALRHAGWPDTDGKQRRVEPGIRLLVDGFPARVGLLRGFGNAIDPRPASAFIKAYMSL